METFVEYLDLLSRLWLLETYFTFDAAQYNRLFDDELAKLSASSPEHRQAIERMLGFNWVGYIAKSLRNAGYRDQREIQERAHDTAVKMLTGGLFSNYDEERHGSLDLRFKRSVANGKCREEYRREQPEPATISALSRHRSRVQVRRRGR